MTDFACVYRNTGSFTLDQGADILGSFAAESAPSGNPRLLDDHVYLLRVIESHLQVRMTLSGFSRRIRFALEGRFDIWRPFISPHLFLLLPETKLVEDNEDGHLSAFPEFKPYSFQAIECLCCPVWQPRTPASQIGNGVTIKMDSIRF